MYTPDTLLPQTGISVGIIAGYLTHDTYGILILCWFSILFVLLTFGFVRLLKNEKRVKEFEK